MEVYVNDESKLTLHGLVQHYTMLGEEGKNKRLMDLLDQLDFNQVCLWWFHTTNMNNAIQHCISALLASSVHAYEPHGSKSASYMQVIQ